MGKNTSGNVTNVNDGGKVGIQSGKGDGKSNVTNVNKGGTVGIQCGNVSGSNVVIHSR